MNPIPRVLLLSALVLSACANGGGDSAPANDDDLIEDDTSDGDDTTNEPYVGIPFEPTVFSDIWLWADEAVSGGQLDVSLGVAAEHGGTTLSVSFPLLLTPHSFDADGKVKPDAVLLTAICADFDPKFSMLNEDITRVIQKWRPTDLPYGVTTYKLVAFGDDVDMIEGWLGPSLWHQVSFQGEQEELMPSRVRLDRFGFTFTKANFNGHWGECNSSDHE